MSGDCIGTGCKAEKLRQQISDLKAELAAARTLLLKLKPYCPMGQGWKDAFDAALKEKQ